MKTQDRIKSSVVSVKLPQMLVEALDEIARQQAISRSELIRRAIDYYLLLLEIKKSKVETKRIKVYSYKVGKHG